MVDFIPRGCVS